MTPEGQKVVTIYLLSAIAIVGIYWYYTKKRYERVDIPVTGPLSTNGDGPPVQAVPLFPKDDPASA